MDQSKKTMRHFYCRDVLWETFEQMANDFDCSIDYLINEAMRYYARSKNYQSAMATQGPMTVPPPVGGAGAPPTSGQGAGYAGGYGAGAPGSQPPRGRPAPSTGAPPPPPVGPNVARRGSGATAPPAAASAPRAASPQGAYREPTGGQSAAGTLYLIFNNQKFPINKDQFIIGRGSKTSDLPIKDGNISRKHAAVIRRNGTFYIKDLGSTNGIDYKGMRIDNKRIDEGDIFHLCDYELRFTYRPE
jgi:hypothetical protein